jgi:hypothetical protein
MYLKQLSKRRLIIILPHPPSWKMCRIKPYSGKLTLRIPPGIHAAVATAAEINGLP